MRTWILGAGFSVRLGGPTLNQLLSRHALDRLLHAFPQTWLSEPACATCVSLLLKGKSEDIWSNAEEYVAALGSCDSKLEADVARLSGGCPRYDDGYNEDPAARFMNSLYCTAIALIAEILSTQIIPEGAEPRLSRADGFELDIQVMGKGAPMRPSLWGDRRKDRFRGRVTMRSHSFLPGSNTRCVGRLLVIVLALTAAACEPERSAAPKPIPSWVTKTEITPHETRRVFEDNVELSRYQSETAHPRP